MFVKVDFQLTDVFLLLFVHEIELGRLTFEHAVPVEVDEAALFGDYALDTAGKHGGVFVLASRHGRQVEDVDHNGPAGHHQHQILEHGMFGAVPEGVAETRVVFDGDWRDGRVDFEAALFEHHHTGVVYARTFGEY